MSLRIHELETVHLETMPDNGMMDYGKIYVSLKFELAIHLCACGWCTRQTVTPFYNEAFPVGNRGWQYSETDGKVTLAPSIGNWNMPCKSHYYVRNGKVEWLSGLDCFGREEGAT